MVLVTPAPLEASDPTSPDQKKKKSKLTTTADAARRLVEYCIVVTSVPRNKGEQHDVQDTSQDWGDDDVFYDDYDFQPVITARYPLEDHDENPLHESTTFFCHPSGIQLRAEPSMPKVGCVEESCMPACAQNSSGCALRWVIVGRTQESRKDLDLLVVQHAYTSTRVPNQRSTIHRNTVAAKNDMRHTTMMLTPFLHHSTLGSLLCGDRRNGSSNVRHLLDDLGTIHDFGQAHLAAKSPRKD